MFSEVCVNGDVRLVEGRTEMEGRVEICYNEKYGTICNGGLDMQSPAVICRQLGYSAELGNNIRNM